MWWIKPGTQCCHVQSPTTFYAQNAATWCWFHEAIKNILCTKNWNVARQQSWSCCYAFRSVQVVRGWRAITMEASVNSFIKTGLFPSNRHIFKDHEFACHGMDESQDKRTDGAGNKISRPGTSSVSFHNVSGAKFISTADVRPIPHLTP